MISERAIDQWRDKMYAAAASEVTTYRIGGREFDRIKFGCEWSAHRLDAAVCPDCLAVRGRFHVPGCRSEACPLCRELAARCECNLIFETWPASAMAHKKTPAATGAGENRNERLSEVHR